MPAHRTSRNQYGVPRFWFGVPQSSGKPYLIVDETSRIEYGVPGIPGIPIEYGVPGIPGILDPHTWSLLPSLGKMSLSCRSGLSSESPRLTKTTIMASTGTDAT